MTITSIPADDRYERFVASGGQTVFPYNFPIYADGDITVSRERAGVAATLAIGTDYTVSGAGNDGGGDVTLTSGATAGDIIVLAGSQAIARTTAFTDGGDFKARDVNAEFNRLVIVLQQLLNGQARSMTLPPTDPAIAMTLPSQADRLGKVLGFDAINGQPTAVAAPGPSGLITSAYMATLLTAADAAAARSGLGATAIGDALITAASAVAAAAAFGGGAEVGALLAAADALAARTAIGAAPLDAPTFTGQVRVPAGTLAAPALRLATAQDGFWIPTAGEIGIASGGAEVARFQATGLKLAANATDTQHAVPRRQVGWEVIAESVNSSAQATVDFTSISAGFLRYRLEIDDCTPAAAATLYLVISNDAGATWKGGASDYEWLANGYIGLVGASATLSGAATSMLPSSVTVGTSAPLHGDIWISPAGAARMKLAYRDSSARQVQMESVARYIGAAITLNAIRVGFTGQNVATHRIRLLGRR